MDLLCLYHEVEESYLEVGKDELAERFEKRLEELYFAILVFIARSAKYFNENRFKESIKDALQINDWDAEVEPIKDSDHKCRELAKMLQWQKNTEGMEAITEIAERQVQMLQDLSNKLEAKSNQSKDIISTAVGDVDAAILLHDIIRGELGQAYENSGQWLCPSYDTWASSPEKSTLWLSGSGNCYPLLADSNVSDMTN
jgi:hypothetical protein